MPYGRAFAHLSDLSKCNAHTGMPRRPTLPR